MLIFRFITGFIYNEFFSVPLSLFGSTKYDCSRDIALSTSLVCEEKDHTDPTYPFGADPIWHGTDQELPFFNSVKMKMSIIFGVSHMSLGIVMSLANALYFRDALEVFFGFIPQVPDIGFVDCASVSDYNFGFFHSDFYPSQGWA